MPVQGDAVPSKLRCEKPGCELTTFTTRSNLTRHHHAKHGAAIRMSCGRALKNHKSNIKRHQKSCVKSCTALDQPSSSPAQTSFELPTKAANDTTETTYLNFTHELLPGEFNDMSFLIDNYTFETPQPE
ncbi:hypothetical protein CABS01_00470 [Colletotrichum abscissum]|uniref:Uncharacterized protein n=1 Tax=Colletotrichum abscissum TaxID=1671311 RepID=A0A9Q0BAT1_9PEZI|nr:uncharacterized protein CABS01_00470 [Colletotrichum abscissum]KAI3559382.1 hypothetical protein CABS02_00357 [Colletotrichum abscissum]KAK1525381.1 hypothetical protein CABS01_00470 [Colletotrichum abscissum]